VVLPFTLLDDGRGGVIEEMPDVDAFSFSDLAFGDEPAPADDAAEPASVDDAAEPAVDAPEPAVDEPAPLPERAPVAAAEPEGFEPVAPNGAEAPAPAEPLDVPEFLAGVAAFRQQAPMPEPVPEPERAPEPPAPEDVGDAAPPTPKVDRSGAFAALLHASAPPVVVPEPEPALAEEHDSAFAAAASVATVPEPLVEPEPPRPEPVQSFVQSRNDLGMDQLHAPEPASARAAEEDDPARFVAAAIQDDLLPQLPKRRRNRSADTQTPALPAQVLRIAAQQSHSATTPAEAEDVVATPDMHVPTEVSPDAPPLPRRELDAAPVAPAAREPAMAEVAAENGEGAPRPNYELFAAFRAATDQGRADAVRRGSDGGGA
jgi:hypothetical protein